MTTEGDGSQSPQEKYQALLDEYKARFGNIGDPHEELEESRVDGYRALFREVFPHIGSIPQYVDLDFFRNEVNTTLLRCVTEPLPEAVFIDKDGNPQYHRKTMVSIPTPKQGKAVILAFGLHGGGRQSALDMARAAGLTNQSPFQRLINGGVRNVMESLIRGAFGEKYPSLVPDRISTRMVLPPQRPQK